MTACHVVDTNVVVVANRMGADDPCADACRAELLVVGQQRVAIDDQRRILDEYFRHAHHSGQPGLGDAFAKRVRDQQYDPDVVLRVPLTADGEWEFVDFPHDPDLATFDRSDLKFVAVACVAGRGTRLLAAEDSDFRNAYDALSRHIDLDIPPACC